MPTDILHDTPEDNVNKELADRLVIFRAAMENALADLAEPLKSQPTRAAQGGAESVLSLVRGFLDSVGRANSQKPVLNALLAAASRCFPRLILFIARRETLVVWTVRDEAGETRPGHASIAHLTIPMHGDHLLARAIASGSLATSGTEGPGFVLAEALGGEVPGRSAAVPLVVRGRPVALLYGDGGGAADSGTDSLFEVLGLLGGMGLAMVASRRPRASADQRERPDAHLGAENTSDGIAAETFAEHPAAPANTLRKSASMGIDGGPSSEDPTASPVGPQAPEEAEMQALLGDLELMRRENSDGGMSVEDRRLHTDARRFASLLISEILLYNEEAVVLGRRNRDISRRLAKEIERSRRTFSARIPENVAEARRYFDEELVRVLAEGDPTALGN